MTGDITIATLLVALLLAVAVLFKLALYFLVLIRFRKRARTAILASLSLANYSEFGLIVGAIALANGWLSGDWLVIIALALTMTFIAAAPLNARAREIAVAAQGRVSRFEAPTPLPEDAPIEPGDARIAIIGMARLGTGAYDRLQARYGDVLIGVDADSDVVDRHRSAGRNVILADATDDDFWARVRTGEVKAVLLAMLEHEQNLGIARRIRAIDDKTGHATHTFAVAESPQQAQALDQVGVDEVWDLDEKAGAGFAGAVIARLDSERTDSIER